MHVTIISCCEIQSPKYHLHSCTVCPKKNIIPALSFLFVWFSVMVYFLFMASFIKPAKVYVRFNNKAHGKQNL